MTAIAAYGLRVDLPAGWEGSIYRRQPGEGETTLPILHAGTFPLPLDRGDYGNGAVDLMEDDDVLVALLEHGPDSIGAALFGEQSMPRTLDPDEFSPTTLQRVIPGHAGTQRFFVERGRPFCLYVVLGSYELRRDLVPRANAVLATVEVEPA